MKAIFLWLVALLHMGQFVMSLKDGQGPLAMTMLGFVIADLGMVWVASQ